MVANSRFEGLITALRVDEQHYVDARMWEDDWASTWVSFSDVLGFASRCRNSEASVVNSIVRFHRSVAAAQSTVQGTDLRLFQFTDAAFAVSRDLGPMLRFVSNLQHQCLAQNAIILSDKDHALAHHLLVVRTTMARGRALILPEPTPPEIRTLGVRASSLLAGDSVVRAYEIEKQTVGAMVAIPEGAHEDIVAESLTVRGRNGRPKTILTRWMESDAIFTHDRVIDFPWILLRPVQDQSELWAESKPDVLKKLSVLLEVADLQSGEFLMAKSRLPVAKHHAGLVRHLKELAQRLEGRQHLRRATEADLRAYLDP